MKLKSQVKAGVRGTDYQHNQTLVRSKAPAKGLKVRTQVKAGINDTPTEEPGGGGGTGGDYTANHNETLVRDKVITPITKLLVTALLLATLLASTAAPTLAGSGGGGDKCGRTISVIKQC